MTLHAMFTSKIPLSDTIRDMSAAQPPPWSFRAVHGSSLMRTGTSSCRSALYFIVGSIVLPLRIMCVVLYINAYCFVSVIIGNNRTIVILPNTATCR